MNFIEEISVGNIILLSLVAIIAILCIKYIIQPYLKYSKMIKKLQGKYKMMVYPFRPYGYSLVQRIIQDFRQYGDSFYTKKHEFSKNDISIGTLRDQLVIGLIEKKLVHDFAQRQKEGCYKKAGGMHFLSFKQLLGDGLLLSESQEWKYKRKVMSSLFNYELIKSKFNLIVSIAKELCQEAKRVKQKDGRNLIEVNKLFQKIFGTVVIRCFFGDIQLDLIQGKDPFNFLSDLTEKVAQRNFTISSFLFGKIFMKIGARKIDRQINKEIYLFREYTKKTIEKTIELLANNSLDKQSEGLIVKLLREKRLVKECPFEDKIKNSLYTYDDLTNEMCTFFFAGTDTTSNAMASLMHTLIQHKQVEEKMRKEIKKILNDDIGKINLEKLKQMHYLRYVQSQIFRFLPSVPQIITREAINDHKLGDIEIRKGTLVNIDIMSHHYSREIFENPFQFLPERWQKLQNNPNISQDFYPFSVGQRVCIGQQLALIESKVALIIFLLNFKNGEETEPVRYIFNLTYGPEKSNLKFEAI